MKVNLLIISILFPLFLFNTSALIAQNRTFRRCGTDELLQEMMSKDNDLGQHIENLEQNYIRALRSSFPESSLRSACEVYTIPVVVHIIYDDNNSNISDEQVISQIEVLNEDYRHLPETPGFGEGVDMGIQFCLAGKDPNGNATTGITRTFSPLTSHNTSRDRDLKELIKWETDQYLNIWVVKSLEQTVGNETEEILGYTFLPGTIQKSLEGIVISNLNFGKGGTALPPFNRGRTLTHEVGHYLGLRHTFNEGCSGNLTQTCLSQGDRVCDTPAEQQPKYGCPSNSNSCTEEGCDLADPIRNYMNYVDDVCMDQFTDGQRDRIRFFISDPGFTLNQITSASNLIATGCTMELLPGLPEPKFSADQVNICPGTTVQFSNESEGCIESVSWTFEGGNPAVSTADNPSVTYATPGIYEVVLSLKNGNTEIEEVRESFIQVIDAPISPPLSVNFESATIPQSWKNEDEAGDGGWEIAENTGGEGNFALVLPNFQRNSGCSIDRFISPTIDLSNSAQATLSFDYAYRAAGTVAEQADSLIIEIFNSCGDFSEVLFAQGGALLSTAQGFNSTVEYIPSSSDWRTLNLDLSQYVGESEVRISFTQKGKGGQNFYLDDISLLTETVSADDDLDLASASPLYPNPFRDELHIELTFSQGTSMTMKMMDLEGTSIWSQTLKHVPAGTFSYAIDEGILEGLSPGIYLFAMEVNEARSIRKVVKFP